MTRTFTFNSGALNTPWSIGFDSLIDRFTSVQHINEAGNYPPYNIVKNSATNWSIELAVSGFKRNDLNIELAEGILTVSANSDMKNDEKVEYIHRGLAKRAFTRKWTLADDVFVKNASLQDGILTINLERIVPEEKRPRKIEIL